MSNTPDKIWFWNETFQSILDQEGLDVSPEEFFGVDSSDFIEYTRTASITPQMMARKILEAGQEDALFGQIDGIHKQVMVATEGLYGSEAFIAGLRAIAQTEKG